MNYVECLAPLTSVHGITGSEGRVSAYAAELLKPLCDEAYETRLKSAVGIKRCGKKDAPKLMMMAHLDSIGMYVSEITDDGYLRFCAIGIDPRTLPDREVIVLDRDGVERLGIIACLPPHVLTDAQRKEAPTVDKLAIDMGYTYGETVKLFPIGSEIRFNGKLRELKNDFISAPSLDDRVGFAIILDILERLDGRDFDYDVYAVGSAGEERFGTGGYTATFEIDPDCAIVLDVSHAATPDSSDVPYKLGCGPMIAVGPAINRDMQAKFIEIAKEKEIPYVIEAIGGGTGTDADEILATGAGIPLEIISIPEKYMHTPFEVVKLSDLDKVAELITEFIVSYKGGKKL